MKKISIVVPCYNEAKNIPIILEKFSRALKGYSAELLLVNNGSTDESREIFNHELQNPEYSFAKVMNVTKNIGYGHGVMIGLRQTSGEILAWTHADLQTDPADVVRAYQKFLELGIDNKVFIKGKRVNRRVSEKIFTFGMASIASIVLGKVLYDINAQPKMFHKSFVSLMRDPPNDFSLDVYALYLAKRYGYRVATIPVYFGKRIYGESKSAFNIRSRLKTIIRTIKYIFYLRVKTLFGKI